MSFLIHLKHIGFENTRNLIVEESIHVKFNDGLTSYKRLSDLMDDFADMPIGSFVPPKKRKIK